MKLFKWIGDWWTEKKRLRESLELARAFEREASHAIEEVKNDRDRKIAIMQEQLKDSNATLKRVDEVLKWHEAEAAKLREELSKAKRPHVVKVPERAMKEEDLQGELAVDDEDLMWRAVHQLLDRAISMQVDAVATASGEKRIEAAGGIAALTDFQTTLLDYQRAGLKAEAGEVEKEGAE
ncbi:MAG: hypothetical protein WC205_04220 [Opitutaceae bacterium]|jgi:seryl-tRNA synthetase